MKIFYKASVSACESGVGWTLTDGNENREQRLAKSNKRYSCLCLHLEGAHQEQKYSSTLSSTSDEVLKFTP